MNGDKPLEPGEHLDIDGDYVSQVRRSRPGTLNPDSDNFFIHQGNAVIAASRADIRTLAELAGVIDSGPP